jgi:choice-of-anchor C domain-containing protein
MTSRIHDLNLLKNGSFEQGPPTGEYVTLSEGSTDIPGWVVTRDTIDYYGTGWESYHGEHSLDLNGTPGIGGIAQTFKTTPGDTYLAIFHQAGHPSGLEQELGVSAAGQQETFSFQSGTDPNNLGWEEQIWEFTATDDHTTLEFYSLQTDYPYGGPALDAVAVIDSDWLWA